MGATTQESPTLPETNGSNRASDQKRILVAESDGFTRIVLMLLLRIAGWSVDFASNGTMALQKIRISSPDVLLLEQKLTGLSGVELVKKARREAGFGNRPIYVFTCQDQLSRAALKELKKSVTNIFDKRAVSTQGL